MRNGPERGDHRVQRAPRRKGGEYSASTPSQERGWGRRIGVLMAYGCIAAYLGVAADASYETYRITQEEHILPPTSAQQLGEDTYQIATHLRPDNQRVLFLSLLGLGLGQTGSMLINRDIRKRQKRSAER